MSTVSTRGSAREGWEKGLFVSSGDFVDRVFGAGAADADGTRRGWFGAALATGWLLYLVPQIYDSWVEHGTGRAAGAAVAVLAFGGLIVTAFVVFRRLDWDEQADPRSVDPRIWPLLAGMAALSAVLMVLLGAAALPTVLYIAVVAIFSLPTRRSAVVVAAVSATMVVMPVFAPGRWLGGTALVLAVIPPVIWLAREIGLRGRRLQAITRSQRADLAIEAERNRVARDVHDILGHSLTVITIKTELAQRLIDVDVDRAKTELADVERLAREALAGVRDTVGGLREVSLRRELATAHTALTAAEIVAVLPDSTMVDTRHSELFGWVLREAVTNVVRHSAAGHCTVVVTENSIEITDDGHGFDVTAPSGSGLRGLAERLRAAGGTLTISTPSGGGVGLLATVPAEGSVR
ncbi:sensor histidine kinase [Nocardia alba]|uniref:Two-component system sensor histidine kinase DesK n=1 Tax=Nocardia alba TaxID=225051 RepID=A0A4R1FHV2_9NOCA|nr:sensor histidine kinase [Nocardia alba]TCJ93600.1 two-component system sensor histidine kinase DesK [Nocardia alba]